MNHLSTNRTNNVILNYLSSIVLTAITFFTAMISSRLVLKYIGDERFGAFRSLIELFGFLNLVDVGLSSSLRPLLAKAMGTGCYDEIHKIMQSSYRLFKFALLLSIFFGVVVTYFSNIIIPVPIELNSDLYLACLIFCVGTINILISPLRCLCETVQKLSTINLLLVFQSMSVTLTSIFFVRLFPEWGITVLSASLTFWVFVYNGFLYIKMRHVTKSFLVNHKLDKMETLDLRDLIRSGRDNFLLMLAGRASLQTNNLFVGLFQGQADVTKLYATQRLFEVIQTQLFAVGNASWAALAQIYHQNKLDVFRTRVLQLLKLIMILGLSVVVPLLFHNKEFVGLWIGSERFGGNSLTIVSALLTLALGFTVFSSWCLMSTGHLQSVLRLSVITAILDVSATLFFTKTLGLIGPALGSCIVLYFVTIPWHILLLKKKFGIDLFSIAKTFKLPILTAPFYIALNVYLAELFSIGSMIMLANLIFWPAIFYQIFQAYFVITKDQWRQIKSRFHINN